MTVQTLSSHHKASLLVELLTEELPPKALERLGEAFATSIYDSLAAHQLTDEQSQTRIFATPRRLAVSISDVRAVAPEQAFTEKLMPVKIGLDAQGQFTPALQKRLAAKGLEHLAVADLQQIQDGKQMFLVASGTRPGKRLDDCLQEIVQQAIGNLPIPKVMRYQLADGVTSVSFVRPAHGLVCLHGERVVPIEALGLQAGRTTQGHRFLDPQPISIDNAHASTYETALARHHVTACFTQRRQEIWQQLNDQATKLNATLSDDPAVKALLNEVTALVEAVAVYPGSFEPRFLAVPQECLILTMRLNQKYFPLFDPQTGKLTHHFLIVSNMPIAQPSAIIEGNERVIRPRLADADFFYTTDSKQQLAQRLGVLDQMVYHNKLGSQGARVERLQEIASWIGQKLGADQSLCARAAQLAKADLTTLMVGEFPELQGVMGGYYAQHDGEPDEVVKAIAHQYQLRWTSPITQSDLPAVALYMAERAETLIGIWGIGLPPTGERDPFGLRRAALGLISAFEQLHACGFLPLTGEPVLRLEDLLNATYLSFDADTPLQEDTVTEVTAFVRERYRNQRAQLDARAVVDAVFALPAVPVEQIVARIRATQDFMGTEAALSLSAANKRIGNIIRKAQALNSQVKPELLSEPAEQVLHARILEVKPAIRTYMQQAEFGPALSALATLREPVDTFFDDVMVMAQDSDVRNNRLTLLTDLHGLMNQVADISRLSS